MKKLLALLLSAAMLASLAACSNTSNPSSNGGDNQNSDKTYVIGICQQVQHPALDAATEGFEKALTELLGDKVDFKPGNAAGDSANCSVICTQFVADGVDLILANGTAPLQAAAAATNEIPVLGTSITDYATALEISDWDGVTGMNISGTSDLAPLDQQADLLHEMFPNAKNVGILYCSAEPNSKYQSDVITGHLEKLGYTVTEYTFADSNDVASVTQTACDSSDVIYIPTDNTAASCTEAINNVAQPAGVPIIAGEEGICSGCGVATLSISYYDLGYMTGKMAYDILVNGTDIKTTEVQYVSEVAKKYNPTICEALNITPPEGYEAIETAGE